MREIVFDTETTGLRPEDGERIIELGAVELENGFPTGQTFHEYLNPEGQRIHPDAKQVHGIADEDLLDKPTFGQIADRFFAFVAEAKLVAHNAEFDMKFINSELARISRKPFPPGRVVDTLKIARRKFPSAKNSLDALCSRFGIDNSHRSKHGALLDSELLAEVYIELSGGKQAALILENNSNRNLDGVRAEISDRSTLQRPNPLPDRLNAEILEQHRSFVKTLGDKPVWEQYPGFFRSDSDR